MKQYIQLAFLKAFIVSIGFYLICTIYGFVTNNPYNSSLVIEIVFFLLCFFASLFESLWKNRKK